MTVLFFKGILFSLLSTFVIYFMHISCLAFVRAVRVSLREDTSELLLVRVHVFSVYGLGDFDSGAFGNHRRVEFYMQCLQND